MEQKNYGYVEEKIVEGKDYVFGAYTKALGDIVNVLGDWTACVFGEKQKKGSFDSYSCVTFGALQQVKAVMKHKYGLNVNYSDRFLAKVSGTVPGVGNSPAKVYQAIRDYGCVPEEMWPFTEGMTEEEFFAEIPQYVFDEGKKWKEQWDFKHEYLFYDDEKPEGKIQAIKEGLKRSPVAVDVYAWAQNSDGRYYKPSGSKSNHWVGGLIIGYEEKKYWKVIDSYPETEGDFIKELVWDYPFQFSKIIYLNRKMTPETRGIFWQILEYMKQWLGLQSQILEAEKKTLNP